MFTFKCSYVQIHPNRLITPQNITMEQFLVSLSPHCRAPPHAPEDHRVSTQEVRRQPCVQLST